MLRFLSLKNFLQRILNGLLLQFFLPHIQWTSLLKQYLHRMSREVVWNGPFCLTHNLTFLEVANVMSEVVFQFLVFFIGKRTWTKMIWLWGGLALFSCPQGCKSFTLLWPDSKIHLLISFCSNNFNFKPTGQGFPEGLIWVFCSFGTFFMCLMLGLGKGQKVKDLGYRNKLKHLGT